MDESPGRPGKGSIAPVAIDWDPLGMLAIVAGVVLLAVALKVVELRSTMTVGLGVLLLVGGLACTVTRCRRRGNVNR
ncbi:hypothetical protein [Vulgatibacter sp.]|uniref:hypothetical protein n=1 Tax=Vulgatibacter sp. TaxID=1971226 RepID=UPI0035641EC5